MKSLAKQVLEEVSVDKVNENVNAGYWISPYGEMFPVDQNHITTIITQPEKFGYSMDQIKDIFKKHKEKMGSEGKAREEIILGAIDKGWIRVRSYLRHGDIMWSINIKRLNKKVKDHITDFFQKLSKGTSYLGSEVNIDSPLGVERYSPEEITKYALYNEGFKGPISNKLTIKESIHDD